MRKPIICQTAILNTKYDICPELTVMNLQDLIPVSVQGDETPMTNFNPFVIGAIEYNTKGWDVNPEDINGRRRLSDYISCIPHGIIDKIATGIGATTIELSSARNSIIVTSSRALAIGKHLKFPNSLYIGGVTSNFQEKTSNNAILKYIHSEAIKHKKIIVVADSLGRLLDIIGNSVFDDYFLMVDEIDVYQSDSSYRPALESVIDYYFMFAPKNRCLITATMNEFSNPNFRNEYKLSLKFQYYHEHRKATLISTNNINKAVIEQINLHKEEKILIAYNSLDNILRIIATLSDDQQRECSILCSLSNSSIIPSYYREFDKTCKLPTRIVFMTCAYFAGVDIEDSYHLISVSNPSKSYSILSTNTFVQIYGRCRDEGGILSDSIITRFKRYDNKPINLESRILTRAVLLAEWCNYTNRLEGADEELKDFFGVAKSVVSSTVTQRVAGSESVPLIRRNVYGEFVPAYLNIDYLIERYKLVYDIYVSQNNFIKALKDRGINIDKCLSAIYNETDADNDIADIANEEIQEIIENIRVLHQSESINNTTINTLKAKASYRGKDFIGKFQKLYGYADFDSLIKNLTLIANKNKKAFKHLNNAVMFNALSDGHPLKIQIREEFVLGESYTSAEIEHKMGEIVRYHLHSNIKGRVAISLLRSIFLTSRPKTYYILKTMNPMNIKLSPKVIPTNEKKLLKYFLV